MAANCSNILWPWLGPCFFPVIILGVICVSTPSAGFPDTSRSAEAAAALVEDVAGAGGAVALAARNLTLAVSGVALSMTRNSASL
eukprot:2203477-Pyramimonas_sp.AAC.1